jgi:hypothetical protein
MVVEGEKEGHSGTKTMRALLMISLACGLMACTPTVPDSGDGAGFQDYGTYLRNRTAAQTPQVAPAPSAPLDGFSTDAAAAAIDRAAGVTPVPAAQTPYVQPPLAPAPATTTGERPRGNAPAGIQQETGEVRVVTGGVSDEQDFEAVKQRETIESDKARIERNRATYTVDQPGALPQRSGDAGGSAIVAFALATTHAPGTQMYERSAIRLSSSQAACGRFASPDLAQEAFLANGGPERDRKSLDPDGDGFACAWDPRPFRTALQ